MNMMSRAGELKSVDEWHKELNTFWIWVEKQNRYLHDVRSQTHRKGFKRPTDAFERYSKLLGLVVVKS